MGIVGCEETTGFDQKVAWVNWPGRNLCFAQPGCCRYAGQTLAHPCRWSHSISISNVHFADFAWPVLLYCLRFAFAFTLDLETKSVLAMFSQLLCLGVQTNPKRSRRTVVSWRGKASHSKTAPCVWRLPSTRPCTGPQTDLGQLPAEVAPLLRLPEHGALLGQAAPRCVPWHAMP